MYILILAIGSYGDVLPMIGLGRDLRTRGHTVTLLTNNHFAHLAHLAGLHFVPLGTAEEYEAIADNPALWHPHKGWRLLMKRVVSGALDEAYSVLKSQVIPGHTLLISTTLGFAARLIQETHRIPLVTVHLSPGVFHSAFQAPHVPGLSLPDWLPIGFKQHVWKFLDHTMIDPVVKNKLNRFRRQLGLPPVSRIFHDWLHSPDLVLGFFPEWFAPLQPDWPPHTHVTGFPLFDDASGHPLPSEVHAFLEQGSPPLIFTPGSAMKHGRRFFAEAARVCHVSGYRGIFLTQYPEQLPSSLPNEVKHFSYVPLSQLLPHSAVLIHHGGIGTCSQALQAGVPQVIRPLAFDQFDNAARVKRLEVGTVIPKRMFRAGIIAPRIHMLLHSSHVKRQSQRLKNYFEGKDSLKEGCKLIESRFGFL